MATLNTEKVLKELRTRPENKKCMNCTATFPTYVVLDFGIWVCTTCSGIHREFSHKVKSPTMGTFKADELRILAEGGNDVAKRKWRATWSERAFPEPDSNRPHDIRQFIKKTFIDKQWIASEVDNIPKNPVPAVLTKGSSVGNLKAPPSPTTTTKKPELKKEVSLIDFNDIDVPSTPTVAPVIPSSVPVVNPFERQPTNPQPNPSSNPFGTNSPFTTPSQPTTNPFGNPTTPFAPTNPPFTQPTAQPFTLNPMPNAFGAPIVNPAMPFQPMTMPFQPVLQPQFPNFPPVTPAMPPPTQPNVAFPFPTTTPTQPAFTSFPTSNPVVAPPTSQPTQPTSMWTNDPFSPSPTPAKPPTTTTHSIANDPFDIFGGPEVKAVTTGLNNTKISEPSNGTIAIKPPPSRNDLLANTSTSRVAPAPSAQPAKKPDRPKADAPTCPICGKSLEGLDNTKINAHVDNCLTTGGEDSAPHSTSDNGSQDWAQWFNLAKMDWYFGDIDRKEAERLLHGCTDDSFLVRKSSVKDSYAVSIYHYKKQTVTHTLIEPKGGGWAFQDTARIYPSLVDLINTSPECKGLKPPKKDLPLF